MRTRVHEPRARGSDHKPQPMIVTERVQSTSSYDRIIFVSRLKHQLSTIYSVSWPKKYCSDFSSVNIHTDIDLIDYVSGIGNAIKTSRALLIALPCIAHAYCVL